MRGRYTQRQDAAQIAEHCGVSETFLEPTPRYNIAPTQMVAAINQQRQLVGFKWGLIPSWAKDPAIPTS
jgi:putative SOS response-associated peptidase YedK